MSQKTEQLLKITPESELVFKGTFLTPVTTQIVLENPTGMTMAFKIKTTTPKQYCVKPNFGFVRPGESVMISIILQPFKYVSSEKYRHKFMVQSVIHEEDATGQVHWEKFTSKDLMDSKLLCVFEHVNDRDQAMDGTDVGATAAATSSGIGDVSSTAPGVFCGSSESHNDEAQYRAATSSSTSSSSMLHSGGSGGVGSSSTIGGSGGGGGGGAASGGDTRSQSTNGALFDFSECHSKTVGDNDHYKTVDRMRHDSVTTKNEEINSLREELALMKREQKKLMVELAKARAKEQQYSQRLETSNCILNSPVQLAVCALATCLLSYLFGRYF